jgi:2-polyprenyl-6-methoxyphenol hydroxylase-like FAD-dependent oxidoreductase
MSPPSSVLISGAGPTGLALACDLARRHIPFRIVDKATAYFPGSRGKGLQPRSMEVLDDFGVIESILANGRFHLPFRGYDGAKVVGDRDMHEGREPTPDVPYASPLIIPQWRVEEILRARLAQSGHHVELGVELVGFEQNGDGVIASLVNQGNPERVRANFLVGADGGHSFVRHALHVGFAGETWTTERMLVGDVKVDTLDRDHWHSWPDKEHGWVALCPLPSTDSFQIQAQIGPEEGDQPTLERFQQIIDQRTGGLGIRLHDATWASLYRANIRMVDRYRVGRVFLAGDAAHVHSPAGGQGMNTGIQDAYNLGWKLALALRGAPDWVLDTYEEERLPIAARMLGITSKLHRQLIPKEGAAPQRDTEFLQLGIHYRDCRLAREMREAGGALRAGDRAPDAPCRDAQGARMRLFDLFRGPHFTLLGFGPESGEAGAEVARAFGAAVHTHTILAAATTVDSTAILDDEGHAHHAYGILKATQVLVRPDGYIALVTEDCSANEIRDYIRELYGSRSGAASE